MTARARWRSCLTAAASCSRITSCSGRTTRRDARPARRSRTASTAPSSTSQITTSRSARCGAPLPKLRAYKRRMRWSFPWASSVDGDFNYDFHVTHTEEEWESGAVEYNFRTVDFRPAEQSPVLAEFASRVGTDFATYRREGPGMSAFALEDGVVYHTYSAYERGIDGLWGMYQWLDRAPLGRNETGFWWQRHDEYDSE